MIICADGAASVTGKHSGVVAHVREFVPNVIQTHCMIHRETLAAKHLRQSIVRSLVFMRQSYNINQNLPTSISMGFPRKSCRTPV